MAQPQSHRESDGCEHREYDTVAVLSQHHRQQHAEKRHHGADREFDAARDDHQAQADAEDPKRADLPRQVLKIYGQQKVWVDDRDDDAENDQENEDAELFFHKSLSFGTGCQTHHSFFAELGAVKNARHPPFMHHRDAVADSQHFFHLTADYNH